MNPVFIGVVIFLAAYAANRFIMTNATNKLDDSLKLKFFEVFSKRNNYSTLFLLIVVIIYWGAIQIYPQHNFAITAAYLIVFIFYQFFKFTSNYQKLKQMDAPPQYINSFIISYGVFILGFLGFALCMIYGWF